MSPTIFRESGYRFFLFLREEPRLHVHVQGADGEAKFWLEPRIELAQNFGLSTPQLRVLQHKVEAHADEIRDAWRRHFGA